MNLYSRVLNSQKGYFVVKKELKICIVNDFFVLGDEVGQENNRRSQNEEEEVILIFFLGGQGALV